MVDGGDQHACGLTLDGVTHCWGSWIERLLPNPLQNPTNGTNWLWISAGAQNSCAVQNLTGISVCWGNANTGINDIPATELTPVPGGFQPEGFRQISVGTGHACGILRVTGRIVCWGAKSAGAGYIPYIEGAPAEVQDWERVEAGYTHSCGRSTAGQDYCWGTSGNYRTTASQPGLWSVMDGGNMYTCGMTIANNTHTSRGYCYQVGSNVNLLCKLICREDIPQMMITINHFKVNEGGITASCRDHCCSVPDENLKFNVHTYSGVRK